MSQKKSGGRTPRPYIKPSMQLALHVEENGGTDAKEAVSGLLAYLVANGLRRRVVKKRRRAPIAHTQEPTPMAQTAQPEDENAREKNPSIVLLGLRSVLRELNKATADNTLAAICLDSDMVGQSSAVSNVFGLVAIGGSAVPPKCPFFVLPQLSTALADELNLPRCSAIGFTEAMKRDESGSEVMSTLLGTLQPIDITSKAKKSSQFTPPTLHTPKGKMKWGKRGAVSKKR